MIVSLEAHRLETVEQIREFLSTSGEVAFRHTGRGWRGCAPSRTLPRADAGGAHKVLSFQGLGLSRRQRLGVQLPQRLGRTRSCTDFRSALSRARQISTGWPARRLSTGALKRTRGCFGAE